MNLAPCSAPCWIGFPSAPAKNTYPVKYNIEKLLVLIHTKFKNLKRVWASAPKVSSILVLKPAYVRRSALVVLH